jgi:hypothetical protein
MSSRKEGMGFKINYYPLPQSKKCYGCLCSTCNVPKTQCRFKSKADKCINCYDNNNVAVRYCDNYITKFDNRFKVLYSKRTELKQRKYSNDVVINKLDEILSFLNNTEKKITVNDDINKYDNYKCFGCCGFGLSAYLKMPYCFVKNRVIAKDENCAEYQEYKGIYRN